MTEPRLDSKFVQITMDATEAGDSLAALDEDGVVWLFDTDGDYKWHPVSSERSLAVCSYSLAEGRG